jgi:hypothetical protein
MDATDHSLANAKKAYARPVLRKLVKLSDITENGVVTGGGSVP